jgi:NAD(P)-dependent dehydrogenase (short-subunit alcohol dehydrogenase family)
MEITGRGVLITGASRGLGRALAQGFARAGARVVLVARGADEVEAVAEDIRREGGAAFAVSGDLGAKEDIHRITGVATALVGPLDIVVNNASTLGPVPLRMLHDTACEDLAQVLEVNLLGPFRLGKAVLGGMILRGRGLILNVTSDASLAPYAGWGAYSVSKAALDHLARVWAAEVEGTGVRFLSIDPGEMDTEMHAAALPEADRGALADPATVAERLLELVRLSEGLPNGARVVAALFPAPVGSR